MFTGIVEETGIVERIKPAAKAIELTVRANVCGRGLRIGDSLAVNGCCLTVVSLAPGKGGRLVRLDLLQETWNRTNLSHARPGSLVNLERPLLVGARVGGHFVTGHVDGTGTISRWEKSGQDNVLEIVAPSEVMKYLVFKGSITVDGISLAIAAVLKKSFRVWIIPHTYATTVLHGRAVGDVVNLEADLLGKYVRHFITGK
jgi:riboflavin synthase